MFGYTVAIGEETGIAKETAFLLAPDTVDLLRSEVAAIRTLIETGIGSAGQVLHAMKDIPVTGKILNITWLKISLLIILF